MLWWGSKVIHNLLLAFLIKIETYSIKTQHNWDNMEHGIIWHNSMGLSINQREVTTQLKIPKYRFQNHPIKPEISIEFLFMVSDILLVQYLQ